jgi:hypothetical protein
MIVLISFALLPLTWLPLPFQVPISQVLFCEQATAHQKQSNNSEMIFLQLGTGI